MSALGFKAKVNSSLVCYITRGFLRFTSGATSEPEPFRSTYLQIMYRFATFNFLQILIDA